MAFQLRMAALIIAALGTVAGGVRAQDVDPLRREARAHFEAGLAAAEADRWPNALRSFEEAYRLSGAPVARFNIAFALNALGRTREARHELREVISDERLDPDRRTRAERLLAETERTIARLDLVGLDTESAVVVVDGRPEERADGSALELDPGHHVLSVSAAGFEAFHWEGDLEPGDRRELAVRLQPAVVVSPGPDVTVAPQPAVDAVAAPASARTDSPPDDGASVLESPWFWAVVGLVVAAGVAVGIGVALSDDETQLPPLSERRYSL